MTPPVIVGKEPDAVAHSRCRRVRQCRGISIRVSGMFHLSGVDFVHNAHTYYYFCIGISKKYYTLIYPVYFYIYIIYTGVKHVHNVYVCVCLGACVCVCACACACTSAGVRRYYFSSRPWDLSQGVEIFYTYITYYLRACNGRIVSAAEFRFHEIKMTIKCV